MVGVIISDLNFEYIRLPMYSTKDVHHMIDTVGLLRTKYEMEMMNAQLLKKEIRAKVKIIL